MDFIPLQLGSKSNEHNRTEKRLHQLESLFLTVLLALLLGSHLNIDKTWLFCELFSSEFIHLVMFSQVFHLPNNKSLCINVDSVSTNMVDYRAFSVEYALHQVWKIFSEDAAYQDGKNRV